MKFSGSCKMVIREILEEEINAVPQLYFAVGD